ncbi:MAG: hypothetical protein GY702_25505 [Desulfobulbaceae bacterium]|nr:hypothetical protein [Desulfobulbaceae bacterium]
MKVVALIFAVLSGCCLVLIQMRKKLPLFGSISSPKLHCELDKTDKKLALAALMAFLVCILSLVATL